MLKFVKHSVLLLVYFIVSQVIMGFLMFGKVLETIPGSSPSMVEQGTWISAMVGIVLGIVLTIVLWKLIYPRKQIDYRVDCPWFHQLRWPILLYVVYFISQFLIPVTESENQKVVVDFIVTYPLIAFFAVVVFAPLLEELIFRGFLGTYFFPKMLDMKAVAFYLIVTGSLFSLVHGPATLPQFLLYFIMGLNLGWFYLLKRDLRYSIAVHMLNNAISYATVVFFV